MKHLSARWGGRLALTAALISLAATAFGSGGTISTGRAAAPASAAHYNPVSIIVVSGPLLDPFFSALKKGSDQAARDLSINYQYSTITSLSNPGPDLARLIDAAVTRKPDALVVSEFFADAEDPAIQRAAAAGIPVVFINAGPNWQKLGGVTYVGEDPALVGSQAGMRFAQAGARHGLCVDHVPGNPTLVARCSGLQQAMKQAGGTSKVLNIPTTDENNATAVTQDIIGALRADRSIDSVFTLGSGIAEYGVKALSTAGLSAKVKLGTTDVSKNVLSYVQSGSLLFAIDQQPYLQGYYGVLIASQKVRFGFQPIGQVKTAPFFITKDNVEQVIKLNSQGGIRGAA